MRARLFGAAALSAATIVAAREAARRRDEQAFARAMVEPGPVVMLRGEPMRLPVLFHRSDGFAGFFGADLERVAGLLPTDALHPVRLGRDRAAVFVGAFRHHEPMATMADGETRVARPYGEVFVAIMVTRRPAPPALPLVATSMFRPGAFVLYLPVTSRLAMDAGRLWNYPKFVADMDFIDEAPARSVTVSEGGHRVLTIRILSRGQPSIDHSPTVLYSERGGRLLEMSMPTDEVHRIQLGWAGGSLELGDHPVADTLRSIGLAGEPVATMTILHTSFAMTAGRELGEARPYRGYAGVERDFGRYTVRHAGTPPIDQYADWGPGEWTVNRGQEQARTWTGAAVSASLRDDRVPAGDPRSGRRSSRLPGGPGPVRADTGLSAPATTQPRAKRA